MATQQNTLLKSPPSPVFLVHTAIAQICTMLRSAMRVLLESGVHLEQLHPVETAKQDIIVPRIPPERMRMLAPLARILQKRICTWHRSALIAHPVTFVKAGNQPQVIVQQVPIPSNQIVKEQARTAMNQE
jgi:hypothetical protein